MNETLRKITGHFETVTTAEAAVAGAMWPAMLDDRTGRFPEEGHVPERVYRLIGAPRGSTLYWDQPHILAAHALTFATGNPAWIRAVDRYIEAFLDRCIAENGMFLWGNHSYYDVFRQEVVFFSEGHHELRPITPAWNIFWRLAPEPTARYIRVMSERHVYDPATGGFNRHDDGRRGHAFIEAGGVLVESLAWLHAKTGDNEFKERALRIARYSFGHRDPGTGLVPNEPDMGRWDAHVCTSEVGLWAKCLLRAWRLTGIEAFADMAEAAVRAYLMHAYDPDAGRYAGQVSVRTGAAAVPERPGYWPGRFANPWNTDQWPTHDYPIELAESALELFDLTGDTFFVEAVHRWAAMIVETCPTSNDAKVYAEDYGRAIRFLSAAGRRLGDASIERDAARLAEVSVARLYGQGLFLGYSGGHVYEAVDGVGVLLSALLDLARPRAETGGVKKA